MPGSKKQGPTLRERRSQSGRVLCHAVFNGRFVSFGAKDDPETRVRFARFKAEWEANGRRLPDAQAHASRTVDELSAAYLAHAAIYYRRRDGTPTNEVANIEIALRDLRALYGSLPAASFDLPRLKVAREAMIENDLARGTINGRVARIVRMFAWAAEELAVPPEVYGALRALRPLKKGRSPAKETEPRRPVPEADFRATLPHLSPTLQALALFLWHSGARIGEAIQLRGRDVDMAGKVWLFQPAQHKLLHRDKPRIIAIGEKAQAVLRRYVKLDPDAYWLTPGDALNEMRRELRSSRATPLWPSHVSRYAREKAMRQPRVVGERYDVRAVARAIRRACERADVPIWSPHRVRHAALTRIRREKGIEAAAAIAGHSALAMADHYSHEAQRALALRVASECG